MRIVTDQNAHVVARHDYLPFGEEITSGYAGRSADFGKSDASNNKFTGQYRDPESGLDFFQARYFGAALGRFTSPDPRNAGADPANPQSWNAYAYVQNNPLNATDPSGMCLATKDDNGGDIYLLMTEVIRVNRREATVAPLPSAVTPLHQ